jgi:hypothetical protein
MFQVVVGFDLSLLSINGFLAQLDWHPLPWIGDLLSICAGHGPG